MDNFKNNAFVTVSTGYNAAATSIVLSGGDGLKLPTVPFNAEWYDSTVYARPSNDPNVEIVRVTAISTDTLTITRAQEGTSASTKNTGGSTYKLIAGITALTLNTHTGTGQLVLDTSPTIATPTIGDLTNSAHSHQNAAGGGSLDTAAIGSGTLAAARMPALTGDVTTLAGAVATTIASGVVTLAKMANMATDSIIGRATASTGVPEVLTALPFAYTGDVTRPADSNATTIAAGVVSLAKMADVATDSILGRATAGTGSPEVLTALPFAATGDVTRPADSTVTTIAANAVTLAKMATMATDSILGRATAGTGIPEVLSALPWADTGDVTRAADGTATTIANDAVTYAKIQNVTTAKVLGRFTAGSGDVEELSTTGTGNAAFSASPTFTGTMIAAAITASGTVSTSFLASSGPVRAGISSIYSWNGSTQIASSANGAIEVSNTAVSARASIQQALPPQSAKTGDYTVVALDNGKRFNNIGAAGTVIFTLPTSVAGQQFWFDCYAAQILRVKAAGSDTIRYGATVSAAAGTFEASTKHCTCFVFCIVAGEWFVSDVVGAWTGPT